jgi:transcriptional antiterminator RfaH
VTPVSVDDSVVDALKAREDESGFVRLERRSPFSPGDRVRVVDGAFVDSIALVEGVTDRERVSILLEFLGRKVRVLVGAELIAAA